MSFCLRRCQCLHPAVMFWMPRDELTGPGLRWLDVRPAGFVVDGQRDIDPIETGDEVVGAPELGEGLQYLGLAPFISVSQQAIKCIVRRLTT